MSASWFIEVLYWSNTEVSWRHILTCLQTSLSEDTWCRRLPVLRPAGERSESPPAPLSGAGSLANLLCGSFRSASLPDSAVFWSLTRRIGSWRTRRTDPRAQVSPARITRTRFVWSRCRAEGAWKSGVFDSNLPDSICESHCLHVLGFLPFLTAETDDWMYFIQQVETLFHSVPTVWVHPSFLCPGSGPKSLRR